MKYSQVADYLVANSNLLCSNKQKRAKKKNNLLASVPSIALGNQGSTATPGNKPRQQRKLGNEGKNPVAPDQSPAVGNPRMVAIPGRNYQRKKIIARRKNPLVRDGY
jgi:hypothetical protein